MPDPPEVPEKSLKEEVKTIQEEISDLVHRALIQAGDLQDIEGKLKDIVEKSNRLTPLPEIPPEPIDPETA